MIEKIVLEEESLPENIQEINKRNYAAFNRERISRMNGKIALHDQTVDLDKVIFYGTNDEARTRDQFDTEIPEAMEAQMFLEWLNNGKKF